MQNPLYSFSKKYNIDYETLLAFFQFYRGGVYFLTSGSTGLTKIGRTVSLSQRIGDIQRMNAEHLVVSGVVARGYSLTELYHGIESDPLVEIEASYHLEYSEFRKHGEWFALEDVVSAITNPPTKVLSVVINAPCLEFSNLYNEYDKYRKYKKAMEKDQCERAEAARKKRAEENKVHAKCLSCQSVFTTTKYRYFERNKRFCSRRCLAKFKSLNGRGAKAAETVIPVSSAR